VAKATDSRNDFFYFCCQSCKWDFGYDHSNFIYNKGTRWRGAKDFCSAYSDGKELLSLIRFTFSDVKTHLIIEVEADSYHATKKEGDARADQN
jgi:hypothetical protein